MASRKAPSWRLRLVSMIALATSACSLLVGTDDLSGAGASAGDASAPEGAVDGAGPAEDAKRDTSSTDGGPGMTNLLENGGFETDCSGVWSTVDAFATITTSSVAHGGTHSCQICSSAFDAGASLYFITNFTQTVKGVTPASGASYEGAVWLKKAPAGGDFEMVGVQLVSFEADGGVVDQAQSPPTLAMADWTRVAVTKTLTSSGSKLTFSVSLRRFTDQSACVLVDDAELLAK